MQRFRYRTPALVGRWWPTRQQAVRDALDAGQATQLGARRIALLSCAEIEDDEGSGLPQSFS
jgi:hypothetical protein